MTRYTCPRPPSCRVPTTPPQQQIAHLDSTEYGLGRLIDFRHLSACAWRPTDRVSLQRTNLAGEASLGGLSMQEAFRHVPARCASSPTRALVDMPGCSEAAMYRFQRKGDAVGAVACDGHARQGGHASEQLKSSSGTMGRAQAAWRTSRKAGARRRRWRQPLLLLLAVFVLAQPGHVESNVIEKRGSETTQQMVGGYKIAHSDSAGDLVRAPSSLSALQCAALQL